MRAGSSWAITAALAGFLFGFDTAVISGAEQAVQREWAMSDAVHGLAISAALWGTVIGALTGGWPSDRFGRKPTLIWIGVLYALSAIGSALAWDPVSFMLFRLIGGLGVGASSVAAPAYLAEIAPRDRRGGLVALFQTMIVLGILIAFASNFALGGIGNEAWRWMLGAEALPAIAYLIATFFIPESPRWLLIHGQRRDEALTILSRISPGNVKQVVEDIEAEAEREAKSISWGQFFTRHYRRPALMAFAIAAFNQLSGINAIIYYAPRIFELSGAGGSTALLASVGIGAVNMVFTLAGLMLIDRRGRKFLMYVGCAGYLVSLGMTAYGFASDSLALVMPFIFAFIAAHAIGSGAVIWVYISETFPSSARAKGQSLGAGTHWVFAAVLTLVMPAVLANVSPVGIFVFFAAMMAVQLVWVRFVMIETRGRSLEEISANLLPARST
ncbi:sugar porter family MFS transporter [Croceicoccus mobilis]|uniref:MFS transporter n=1 Tax=Croceicoccus mobilis TaxID=1703339 RepID=A0A917DQZ7_9SPHN|nr:sugar porter family MFS transporter [Croceicoccus mobilis]GGD62523.1 MFS transporter [Croceicoccus mobilis]